MNIYVGNLSHDVTETELREAFEASGEVSSCKIITDRLSGASRGFGFIEMPTDEEAKKAMAELNGTEMKGQAITVNEARPRNDSRGGGGRRF
ncbi:MAG: RNA-binding protein [Methanomassiliicoccales archaeon]|nr:MAG: RNA-binding protein [Methanomassiliicoccales archaeon]